MYNHGEEKEVVLIEIESGNDPLSISVCTYFACLAASIAAS